MGVVHPLIATRVGGCAWSPLSRGASCIAAIRSSVHRATQRELLNAVAHLARFTRGRDTLLGPRKSKRPPCPSLKKYFNSFDIALTNSNSSKYKLSTLQSCFPHNLIQILSLQGFPGGGVEGLLSSPRMSGPGGAPTWKGKATGGAPTLEEHLDHCGLGRYQGMIFCMASVLVVADGPARDALPPTPPSPRVGHCHRPV